MKPQLENSKMSDAAYVRRLLDDVLGRLSFHGETYADKKTLEQLDIYEVVIVYIYCQMRELLCCCDSREESSAVRLFSKTHRILKDYHKQLSSDLERIDYDRGVLSISYIEGYLADNKNSEFFITCRAHIPGELRYCAVFREFHDKDKSYKHLVCAKGYSREEVIRKIATYLASGKTYNDGRNL